MLISKIGKWIIAIVTLAVAVGLWQVKCNTPEISPMVCEAGAQV